MKFLDYQGLKVYWDGHASVRAVDGDFTVAVDPYSRVSPDFEAGIVLVTHADSGHFDPGKLEDVCGDRTCVVAPSSMEEEEIPCLDIEYVEKGEVIDIYGVEIEAVPMYNDHHERGTGLGYRFVMDDTSIYVAGDTGLIDEVREIEGNVDIAFLPVEGVFTMDVEDAVKMAVRVKPDVVVPYHYGEPFFDDSINLKGFASELEDRNIRCKVLGEKGKLEDA